MVDQKSTSGPAPTDMLKQGVALGGLRQGITPRTDNSSDQAEGVVIKGLSQEAYLNEAFLMVSGYVYNPIIEKWEEFREPIMNRKGIGNFMKCLHTLKRIDFSNFDNKQIAQYVFKYYKNNFIQFIAYAEEFGLAEEDYNIIKTELMYNCLASFNNAKGAGHRNVIRGTMSESVFLKALGQQGADEKKGKLFGFLPNPFGKKNS